MTTTIRTAREMKDAYAKATGTVKVHFTAKGNAAWRSYYITDERLGLWDSCRISKKDAAEKLAAFGLTTEQIIAVAKAEDVAWAEEKATARRENRRAERRNAHSKALEMVFGKDEPEEIKAQAEANTELPKGFIEVATGADA